MNDSTTFVGTAFSQALSDEIDQLGAHDILFVTAAGNTAQNNDSTPRYPCDYGRPTELCVAASDQNDRLPSWANYGATTVDLAAPGSNIYSTLRGASYGYINGSSMAAAEVSGAAALILSVGYQSVTALKADILDHVDPVPALTGRVRTGGRLDVCAALPGCTPPSPSPPSNTAPPVVSGSARVGQSLSTSNGSWAGSPTGYSYQWERCDTSGTNCAAISRATSPICTLASADTGATLEAAVTAHNSAGSATATSAHTATTPGTTIGTPCRPRKRAFPPRFAWRIGSCS